MLVWCHHIHLRSEDGLVFLCPRVPWQNPTPFQQWSRGLSRNKKLRKKNTCLSEIDVRKPLVVSTSQSSEELRLYTWFRIWQFQTLLTYLFFLIVAYLQFKEELSPNGFFLFLFECLFVCLFFFLSFFHLFAECKDAIWYMRRAALGKTLDPIAADLVIFPNSRVISALNKKIQQRQQDPRVTTRQL